MDIRFKTGKAPTVKFSDREQSAAKLVVETLAEYSLRMDDNEAEQVGDALVVLATGIGLLDKPQEPTT